MELDCSVIELSKFGKIVWHILQWIVGCLRINTATSYGQQQVGLYELIYHKMIININDIIRT